VERLVIYHFNIHDGRACPETVGTEFLTKAGQRTGKLLAEEPARFWTGGEWSTHLTDSDGLTLFSPMLMAANWSAVGVR
jgi:hypothetical protein